MRLSFWDRTFVWIGIAASAFCAVALLDDRLFNFIFKSGNLKSGRELGVIVSIDGEARQRSIGETEWSTATKGTKIYLGDRIFSGKSSQVVLALDMANEGSSTSEISMGSDTLIVLLDLLDRQKLKVESGQLDLKFLTNSESSISVETAGGEVFDFNAAAPSTLSIQTKDGKAEIASKLGEAKVSTNRKKLTLKAGSKVSDKVPAVNIAKQEEPIPLEVVEPEPPPEVLAPPEIPKVLPEKKVFKKPVEKVLAKTTELPDISVKSEQQIIKDVVNGTEAPGKLSVRLQSESYDLVKEPLELSYSQSADFKDSKTIKLSDLSTDIAVQKAGKYFVRLRNVRTPQSTGAFKSSEKIVEVIADEKIILTSPKLLYPLNNLTIFADSGNMLSVDLVWKRFKGPATYDLQISTDKDFSKIVYEKSVTISNVNIHKKINSAQVYWRVRSVSGQLESPWSKPRKIIIASE